MAWKRSGVRFSLAPLRGPAAPAGPGASSRRGGRSHDRWPPSTAGSRSRSSGTARGAPGSSAFRLAAGAKARWRHVPDGPALFVYGHSYAALEGATLTPWPVFVAEGLGLPLVNRAVGGDVVRDTLRRAKVRRGRPDGGDVVLVHIGGNDVMRRGRDPQLGEVVPRRARAGSWTSWAGPGRRCTSSPRSRSTPGRTSRGGSTGARTRRAPPSTPRRCPSPGPIDLRPGWDPATMLLDDGIHPNELGVAALTRTILDALRAEDCAPARRRRRPRRGEGRRPRGARGRRSPGSSAGRRGRRRRRSP